MAIVTLVLVAVLILLVSALASGGLTVLALPLILLLVAVLVLLVSALASGGLTVLALPLTLLLLILVLAAVLAVLLEQQLIVLLRRCVLWPTLRRRSASSSALDRDSRCWGASRSH